jgi:hypothetical protein
MNSLRIRLKVQKRIREYEDVLVKKIVDAFKPPEGKPENFQYEFLKPSQYQNLVQVALSTESSEVIKNFLRYQLGRENKWGKGPDCLAERIIKDIQEGLKTQAEEIAKYANKKDENKVQQADEKLEEPAKVADIHIELIRRYLGYGKRHLTYLKPEGKERR